MIKDITPPAKNLNTDDLLGNQESSILVDTKEEELEQDSKPLDAADLDSSVFSDLPEEGIQVAGGISKILEKTTTETTKKSTIKNIKGEDVPQDDLKDKSIDELNIKAKKQKIEEMLDERNLPEGDLVQQKNGQVILDVVDNIEYDSVGGILKDFDQIPIEQLEGNVDDILKRLGTTDPDEINNLDDLVKFSFADEITRQGGNQTVDNETIRKLASELNLPDLYRSVLKRKKGDILGNVEIYRAIQETMVMRKLYVNAIKNLETDPTNPQLLEKANKYFRVYGLFLSRVSGDMSETARKLRFSALAKQDYNGFGNEELSTVLKGIEELNKGNPSDMIAYHKRFLILPLDKQQDMVRKGMFRKIVDGGVEVFVNTLLASPITHVVNFVSNLTFNTLRYGEQFIAAGLNKIPGYNNPDGVMLSEAMELVYNFKEANKVGGEFFIQTLKSGGRASSSKLDLGSNRAVSTDVLHPSWKDPNNKTKYIMGKTLDAYGHFARIPGTFLVASDEMTKGVLYIVAQKQLARRRYNEIINTGGSEEAAREAATKVLTNPSVADQNIIKQEGLQGTFQQELPDGAFKKLQGVLNHPSLKIFVPFYKTVTNIYLEVAKRNPTLIIPGMPGSKAIRDDLLGRNGKRAMQLAHSKMLTGTGIMSSWGMLTYGSGAEDEGGFFITGQAPYGRAERQAFFRKGLQPYSICSKQDAGNFECRSYSRFEPISALLAISADTAQFLMKPGQWGDADGWDEKTIRLAYANITAIFPYLTSQPFMTIFTDFQSAYSRFQYSDEENKLDAMISFLTKKIIPATAGPIVNPFGSFGRYLDKIGDENIYDKSLTQLQVDELRNEEYGINQTIIAVYEELNKLRKESPFYNRELPVKLNLWGEDVTGAEGTIISPFKVVNTKFNEVDDFMLKYGFGIPMPDRKIRGIYLSTEEYNDMIRLMNDPEETGEPVLLNALKEMIQMDDFKNAPVGEQITLFKNVVSRYRTAGKQQWFLKYPKIKARIDEMDEIFKRTGKRQ